MAKHVKTRSLQEWVGHFEPKFPGEGVVPGEYFLVSTKLDISHRIPLTPEGRPLAGKISG